MADIVITESHRLSDGGVWVGDDLNVELAGSSDSRNQAAVYERAASDDAGITDVAFDESQGPPGSVIAVTLTEDASVTDTGGWTDDGVAESAGMADELGDSDTVIVRVIAETSLHGDENQPLSWFFYLTHTDASGSSDAVPEPDSSGPLELARIIAEPSHHHDIPLVTGDRVVAEASDPGFTDEVTYRLRTRVNTPPKRTLVVQPEDRTLLVAAPRRRFPS